MDPTNCLSILENYSPVRSNSCFPVFLYSSLGVTDGLTMLFLLRGTTPSLTQKPQAPIMFAIMMSVVSRSPTIATWEG